jgi:hypothetical protein
MGKCSAERQRKYRTTNAAYREREKLRNRKYRREIKPKAKRTMLEKTRLRVAVYRQKKLSENLSSDFPSPYGTQCAESRAVNRHKM